jgi:1-acyl-sn-glycerol-3-phosphate acyltransferase
MKGFWFGRAIRGLARVVLSPLFRVRMVGMENVPAGGALLAGNHVSYMDPVLLWSTAPRPVHFMAKAELWSSRILAWFLPRFWAFPVRRGEPDRTAIVHATEVLTAGGLVGVFPEGTRAEDPSETREAHGGAAFIALRAGVPVVPMAFVGTERIWPRGARFPRLARATIRFGVPIDVAAVAPDAGRKERVVTLTGIIMERIAGELEQARGAH